MGFEDSLTLNLKMGQCIFEVFLNTVLHYLSLMVYFYETERTFVCTFTFELSWPLGIMFDVSSASDWDKIQARSYCIGIYDSIFNLLIMQRVLYE